jgi:tRNA G10  N-methylase Trm11
VEAVGIDIDMRTVLKCRQNGKNYLLGDFTAPHMRQREKQLLGIEDFQ